MKNNISYLVNGVDAKMQGRYKVAIVDSATDKVVWEMPEFQKNLILNGGMDLVNTNAWCALFNVAIVGTGTRPNSYASGATNAVQAATTVTSSGGSHDFTVSAAAGDVIKWDSGDTANVVSVTDANHLVVDVSQTVASGPFTIWKTSQTGLQTEVKRSANYLTSPGSNGTSYPSANQVQFWRTMDFTTETSPVTYTEIGVSPVGTPGAYTFSRILLNTPISIAIGQRIRVVYQLNVTFGPDTPNSKTAAIGGWPVSPSVNTDGHEQIQNLNTIVVTSAGGTTLYDSCDGLEPAETTQTMIWIGDSSAALGTLGGSIPSRGSVDYVSVTKASYVNGSYACDKTGLFDVGQANSSSLRSMGIGGAFRGGNHPGDSSSQSLTFVFDQAQTKANTQTLSLTFRYMWSRTLA